MSIIDRATQGDVDDVDRRIARLREQVEPKRVAKRQRKPVTEKLVEWANQQSPHDDAGVTAAEQTIEDDGSWEPR